MGKFKTNFAALFLLCGVGSAGDIIRTFDNASRLYLPDFAGRFTVFEASCYSHVAHPQIQRDLLNLERHESRQRVMDNRDLEVTPFIGLDGLPSVKYFTGMWDQVQGRMTPILHLLKDYPQARQLSSYVGFDGLKDPAAVIAVAFPTYGQPAYIYLHDIFIAHSLDNRTLNRKLMFRFLLDRIRVSSGYGHITKFRALSKTYARSRGLTEVGFQPVPLPRRGHLVIEGEGRNLEIVDFNKQSTKRGYKMFEFDAENRIILDSEIDGLTPDL